MSRWEDGPEDEAVEFGGCSFGSLSRSGRAIQVRFPDGASRWVPLSQMPEGCPEPGGTGTLVVTAWIAGRWEEEGEDPRNRPVRVPGVVVLRETERAIQVRAPGLEEPAWLAKSHVDPGSEVQNDGDRGTLVVPNWVAEDRGLTSDGWALRRSRSSVAEDARRAGKRREAPPDPRQREVDWSGHLPNGDPDDDIPF